ncbi:MAG: quinolinate synthase NadA [Lachnospiraceae bacterium]|nr:quinolinate synthase NadA [Lachnospiraceae bacterium]
MRTTKEIQDEINRLKKEKDFCILVHAYQAHSIVEIADFTGDSYGLSVQAAKVPEKNVIMCGVRFMAETVKVLSPEKNVYLANPTAGCPMAEQMDIPILKGLQAKYPGYETVAYINTTTELKTICDTIVTSSSADKIIGNIENDKILFVPDPNLGGWIAKRHPDKDFKFFNGGCPTHMRMRKEDVLKAKAEHPDALFLVHPECRAEVVELADYVGSTTGIMAFAKESNAKEFIIGTESSIVEHLQYECPEKTFYPLSVDLICNNMKMTTLVDVLNTMNGTGGEEITLPDETIKAAKKSIDRMIALGG